MKIKIADYTIKPNIVKKDENNFSAEELRTDIISPKIMDCLVNDEKLVIDLDDVFGYSFGFLDEAFAGLIREGYGLRILNYIEFKSNDEPILVDVIKKFMIEEEEKKYAKCKRR